MNKIESTDENWENGLLGCDPQYARKAPPEVEKAIDDALGLQPLSVRVPKELVDALKTVAARRGVAYPHLVRSVLEDYIVIENLIYNAD